jgi:hypothetical protein
MVFITLKCDYSYEIEKVSKSINLHYICFLFQNLRNDIFRS